MNAAEILAKLTRLTTLLATAKGGERVYLERDIAALEEDYRNAE